MAALFGLGGSTGLGGIPPITSKVDPAVDAAQVQKLQEISDNSEKVAKGYYDKIVELIGAKVHPEAKEVTILFTPAYRGVAATGGNRIQVSSAYALAHPDDIPGVIVHELTHVVQAYHRRSGFDTGWLTEGIADYVRWFNFEPLAKRPHPRQSRHPRATAAYQTTAAFLYWATNKYDKYLVIKLNEALYQAAYTPEIWKDLTGKSLEELNDLWVATLEP
jgi:hypothetical protein